MRQFNMSNKELIRTYSFNDIYCNRNDEVHKIVKGRTIVELGTRIATCFVGNLYKVYDLSVESFKYLLLVGVAQQNPNYDSPVEVEEAEEAAALNAQLFPVLTYIVDNPFEDDYFTDLCIVMREMMPTKFIKTPEEKNTIMIEA